MQLVKKRMKMKVVRWRKLSANCVEIGHATKNLNSVTHPSRSVLEDEADASKDAARVGAATVVECCGDGPEAEGCGTDTTANWL